MEPKGHQNPYSTAHNIAGNRYLLQKECGLAGSMVVWSARIENTPHVRTIYKTFNKMKDVKTETTDGE